MRSHHRARFHISVFRNYYARCTNQLHFDAISLSPHSKLYTLEGGVHNYITEEGGELWNGSLFVFDGRLAVAPPGKPYAVHSHSTLM